MTPDEWFAATDPKALLAFVDQPHLIGIRMPAREPAMLRRLRLFAVACARMVWDILPTDARSAVLISERFADEKATENDLRAAVITDLPHSITFQQHARRAAGYASVRRSSDQNLEYPWRLVEAWDHTEAASNAARALATRAAGPVPPSRLTQKKWHVAWTVTYRAARATQADYVRDIFPPPDYTPQLDREWLTSTVVGLAQHMDESGDFAAVPILADALQDAGCDAEPVLQCCRAPVHVRGNWVVDLVLEKA